MNKYLMMSALLLGTLLLIACEKDADVDPNTPPSTSSGDCSQVSSGFNADVMPIIERACSDPSNGSCHQAGSSRGAFTNYNSVKRIVDNGQFASRVLQRKDMPPSFSNGPRALSAAELDILECWIAVGAPAD